MLYIFKRSYKLFFKYLLATAVSTLLNTSSFHTFSTALKGSLSSTSYCEVVSVLVCGEPYSDIQSILPVGVLEGVEPWGVDVVTTLVDSVEDFLPVLAVFDFFELTFSVSFFFYSISSIAFSTENHLSQILLIQLPKPYFGIFSSPKF